jgi:ABC-2 type transport system ATP-binding protein
LDVWENLYFHARYFGMGAKEGHAVADEMLEKFQLAGRRRAAVDTLSGGMAKRLMTARALVHRPAVLFLDEPTAGLDPQSRLALWEILGDLHAEGQTVFLTTHYMEEADQFCDRVAIMDHGRILALDTPTALKRSAGNGDGMLPTRPGVEQQLRRVVRTGYTAALKGSQPLDETAQALAELVGAATKLGLSAENLGIDLPPPPPEDVTLETVFIKLTGRDLRD